MQKDKITCLGSISFIGSIDVEVRISETHPSNSKSEMIYNTFMDLYNTTLQDIKNLPLPTRMSALTEYHEPLQILEEMRQSFRNDGIHLGQVRTKCLRMSFQFDSKEALCLLWSKYITGDLKCILQTGIISEYMLNICNVTSIQLEVFISEEDYDELLERMGQ